MRIGVPPRALPIGTLNRTIDQPCSSHLPASRDPQLAGATLCRGACRFDGRAVTICSTREGDQCYKPDGRGHGSSGERTRRGQLRLPTGRSARPRRPRSASSSSISGRRRARAIGRCGGIFSEFLSDRRVIEWPPLHLAAHPAGDRAFRPPEEAARSTPPSGTASGTNRR